MWRGAKLLLLIMVISAGILNYADRQVIAVIKPTLQHDLHWSDIDYANLNSVFQLASAVALLFAGRLVDAIGWRRSNPLAVGSWSLAAAAHAVAPSALAFGAARFALGATEAFGTPTAIRTLAVVYPPGERSLAVGLMNAANGLGAIVTPFVIPLVALSFGWKACFAVTGGLGLFWVGAWYVFRPDRRLVELSAGAAAPTETGGAPAGWRAMLRDRRTWAIAGAKVLSDQVWWLLLFWAPDLLHRVYHLGLADYGVPLAVMYLSASIGALVAGQSSKWMLEHGVRLNLARKGSLLAFGILALPLALAADVATAWEATLILSLTLAAHQGYSTNIFALATEIVPQARVATVISFCAFLGNLGGLVILQAAGRVLTAGWGYGPLLAYACVSYLLGLMVIHFLLPTLRPVEAAVPAEASASLA